MLTNLHIQDYIIVDELNLSFEKGFIGLTGETGAGKSILIDALSLSLGARSESGLIRKGCEKAEIITEFDIKNNQAVIEWLKDNDLYDDNSLLLRRIIFSDGRSKAYINSIPSQISKLKDVSELLIDIYSQNSFHSLTQAKSQLSILDEYADTMILEKNSQLLFHEWKSLEKRKKEFDENKIKIHEEYEDLQIKIKEYKELNFSFDHWEQVQLEHKKLSNAKELISLIQQCLSYINNEDFSAYGILKDLNKLLSEATQLDNHLNENLNLSNEILIQASELERNLNNYLSKFNDDEERVREIEDYIQGVFNFSRRHNIQPELFENESLNWFKRYDEIATLFEENQFAELEKKAFDNYVINAKNLSEKRATAAKKLSSEISLLLNQLSFSNADFKIDVEKTEPVASGIDQVKFLIKTYKGADFSPIAKTASGGELSRISLAIRVASAKNTNVPVMIFDEVDVGIGGGVAEVVGNLLNQLGSQHQVFSITHLAQVVSKANFHFKVHKEESGETAISKIFILNAEERVKETARMIGGLEITETTLMHAKELLS